MNDVICNDSLRERIHSLIVIIIHLLCEFKSYSCVMYVLSMNVINLFDKMAGI